MLEKVKLALLITGNTFDTELNTLIKAAVKDLGIAGVEGLTVSTDSTDDIVIEAIITYCGYKFELRHGEESRSDKLKQAYDEQKAQLGMATNYTTW